MRGTWSAAHGLPLPKKARPDRPLILRRKADGALAIPTLRLGEWFYAFVSREDTWAASCNWFITKEGYVQRNFNKRTEYLHRLVHLRVAYPDDHERGFDTLVLIDHRNRDRLDNMRRNLRPLSQGEQNRNQHRNDRDDVGVIWVEQRQRWQAHIKHQNRTIFVGRFRAKQQAIRARQRKLRELAVPA